VAEFDVWAEYYDLIHDGLSGDVAFYVEQARSAGGPTLELGVGTGRIAIPMAKAGVHVTGIDNSAAMLEVCRKKVKAAGRLPGRLELIHADMADFDRQGRGTSGAGLGRRFACIAMPYRTFMHLLTPEDQRRCLRAVHRRLTRQGRFVLNTWAPRAEVIASVLGGPAAEKLRLAGRYPVPDRGVVVEHCCASCCDDFRQIITELHVLREIDDDGTTLRERRVPLVRAWTTPREMENLLLLCGFEVRGLYGDFEGGTFTEASTEAVWVLGRGAPQ